MGLGKRLSGDCYVLLYIFEMAAARMSGAQKGQKMMQLGKPELWHRAREGYGRGWDHDIVAGSSLKISASPPVLTMSSENQKAGSESAFWSFTIRGLAVMGRMGDPRADGKPFIASAESSAFTCH